MLVRFVVSLSESFASLMLLFNFNLSMLGPNMSARPALTGEYKLSNRPLQQSTELLKIQVALAQKAGVNEEKKNE